VAPITPDPERIKSFRSEAAFERWMRAKRGTVLPTNELRPPSAFSEPVTGREEVV